MGDGVDRVEIGFGLVSAIMLRDRKVAGSLFQNIRSFRPVYFRLGTNKRLYGTRAHVFGCVQWQGWWCFRPATWMQDGSGQPHLKEAGDPHLYRRCGRVMILLSDSMIQPHVCIGVDCDGFMAVGIK